MNAASFINAVALLAIAGWVSLKTWERMSVPRTAEQFNTDVVNAAFTLVIDLAACVNLYLFAIS